MSTSTQQTDQLLQIEEQFGELARSKKLCANALFQIANCYPRVDLAAIELWLQECQSSLNEKVKNGKMLVDAFGKMTLKNDLRQRSFDLWVKKHFPVFRLAKKNGYSHIPLAIGVKAQMKEVIPAAYHLLLLTFLRSYCLNHFYCLAIINIKPAVRYDLQGAPCGAITKEERAHAQRLMSKWGPLVKQVKQKKKKVRCGA